MTDETTSSPDTFSPSTMTSKQRIDQLFETRRRLAEDASQVSSEDIKHSIQMIAIERSFTKRTTTNKKAEPKTVTLEDF